MPLPNSGEILLLIIAALVILGPSRLPRYAARLGELVRQLRDLAEGAKGQIREELGPGFDDIDWNQLDPRQYDPRRIVREALAAPAPGSTAAGTKPNRGVVAPADRGHDPGRPTPFDVEAT